MKRIKERRRQTTRWERGAFGGNVTLDSNDKRFYISYSIHEPMMLFSLFARKGEETALVKRLGGYGKDKFYVLRGDFRKEFEPAIGKGFSDCMKIYRKLKPKHGLKWETYQDGQQKELNSDYITHWMPLPKKPK